MGSLADLIGPREWQNRESNRPILGRDRTSSLTRLFSGFYHLTQVQLGSSQR